MKVQDMNREMLRYHAGRVKKHTLVVAKKVHKHALSTPKKIAMSAVAFVLVAIVVGQFFYPTNKMVLFATVDGVDVGGLSKDQAGKKLDDAYASTVAPVYYKDDTNTPKAEPKLPDIGITVENAGRVAAIDYPWYWRLVPSSALWYYALQPDGEPKVSRSAEALNAYMVQTFGAECVLAPSDASVAVKDGKLSVVPSRKGGTCDFDVLRSRLAETPATLTQENLVVEGTTIEPKVSDEVAEGYVQDVSKRVGEAGVVISVAGKDQVIPRDTLYSWLVFTPTDDKIVISTNEAATTWLTETYGKSLAVAPGVTSITTRDFLEIARTNGAPGQAIDAQATAGALVAYLGGGQKAKAVSRTVPPTITYTRSYSATDTGMTALMEHFAQSNPGTYGISLVELSGAHRHASYNGTKQFTTASTYKLFVAYSTLLRVEDGRWNWIDQITGGKTLSKCFDDMIVRSDNPCAEALLKKIGFTPITNEAKAIGATRTSFLGSEGVKSTAQDESLLLSLLYSGQILSQQSSRDTFINALKRNIYRKGIPAGVPSAIVANKVGFLDAWLHDAAIVYSPTGTYVLTILTEGSSWAAIAELSKQLEALRNS